MESLDDHFANHASTTVGLAVEVESASGSEGFFPGFAGVEGEIGVAVLIVAFEDSVVRCQFVVDKLDGVACLDVHGGRFESEHAGVCAELHLNGGGLSAANVEANQHQEGAASSCNGADDGAHEREEYHSTGIFDASISSE